jgi:hypothetical protein
MHYRHFAPFPMRQKKPKRSTTYRIYKYQGPPPVCPLLCSFHGCGHIPRQKKKLKKREDLRNPCKIKKRKEKKHAAQKRKNKQMFTKSMEKKESLQ